MPDTKEFYQAAVDALREQIENHVDVIVNEEESEKITFTFEGQEYTFGTDDFDQQRYGDLYWYYYQFDEADEHAISLSAYYDSWGGVSDVETATVGKLRTVTDFVIDDVK